MENITSLQVINEQRVLNKNFKVYGTFEEPLFLAKDVADWIDHSDVSTMVRNIDEEEKVTNIVCTLGGNQKALFLTENGLYEVLMQSRKPIAKQFKKQVKVILKTIRQTGNYIGNVSSITPETIENIIQKYLPAPKVNTKNLNVWKYQTVKPIITDVTHKLTLDNREAYNLIYDTMTSKYGFSRAFAITRFCDKYNLETGSVIDAIADDYTLQQWFMVTANDILDGATFTPNAISSHIQSTNCDEVIRIIKPLAEKYDDKSVNYGITLKKIYQRMGTKQSWKNLRTRRHCKSNKEVILSDKKKLEQLRQTVNEMICE